MTKELTKAIINRSKLRNKFLKLETRNLKGALIAKGNFCVSLLHKIKILFGGNLDHRVVSRNKTFVKLSVLSSQRRLFTKII